MGQLAIRGGEPVSRDDFRQWPEINESDRRAVLTALDSGVWGIGGKFQQQFEAEWASFVGAAFAVTSSSGSTALNCALRACRVQPGDEVILPAYTFQATATSVLLLGAVPVFADVTPDTLCIDPASTAAVVTERTRAILAVHVAGCPADMDGLGTVAQSAGIPLLEDACQAHGASWRGRRVGSIGAAGAFSFQSSKNLPAGEGGAITTSDPAIAGFARAVRNCGNTGDITLAEPVVGSNFRMTEMQAALLLSQLKRLPGQMTTRENNARLLDRELAQIPGITPLTQPKEVTEHAHHLYIFRYDSDTFDGASRERFMEALRAEGIPCHGGYQPLYTAGFLRQAALVANGFREAAGRAYGDLQLPYTETACQKAIWLTQPLLLGWPDLTGAIVQAIQKIYEHREELHQAPA